MLSFYFQQKKLDLANGVLTGAQSRVATKMTIDDLKKIFGIENVGKRVLPLKVDQFYVARLYVDWIYVDRSYVN